MKSNNIPNKYYIDPITEKSNTSTTKNINKQAQNQPSTESTNTIYTSHQHGTKKHDNQPTHKESTKQTTKENEKLDLVIQE